LDRLGVDRDLREALYVEEVRRAEVLVALLVVRGDAGSVDGALEAGLLAGGLDGTLELRGLATNGGDAHVLDRELDARVRRIDVPGANGDGCTGCGSAHLDDS